MYTPKKFENRNATEVQEFIRENGFGILISQSSSLIDATHVPMFLSKDAAKLYGHLSRANQQWKSFETNPEVLAVFNGPHAYISSSWYNHENVPTWNYIAVHVRGRINIVEGDALHASLKEMVDKYEQHSKTPVSVDKMSQDYIRKQMLGIVGFEIHITDMQAAYKLSQNRDKINHDAIVHALEERNSAHDQAVANEMKKRSPLT